MTGLPTGTVTLVFTDIEGSTRLLHELGERYADALAEHRRAVREIFRAHGGAEVDTQGDAFFYAFADAAAAAAAARDAQAVLAGGPVRVRMGLHTGTPQRTAEGYAGLDVHLGARVAAAGHGGQVVLTKAVVDGAGALEVHDLGEHRVKDFDEPVWLYQLGSEPFPPLKTISNTNLPRPRSAFVGRGREVAEVAGLVRRSGIVTLTGPGGSGKTRLAIEAAAELVGELGSGVFWIGLATVHDPRDVLPSIAETLGARGDLAGHIGGREMLLLLDNVEQVVAAAPELAALAEACPNLKLLVTSRELLRVRGEVEHEVLPLAGEDAVGLFCLRSGLAPTPAVEELCRRLDNMPLALELAAARTKALTPGQILDRLGGRLDLFTGGRDAEPRQATLRATIEWSHDLLDPAEQSLFARLGVFAGGSTLESAEQVCDTDLDMLQSLVEKSLVRHTVERFWMLETIREFASERLAASGGLAELQRRHAEHYLALARSANLTAESQGVERPELVRPELDNVRAAIDWATGADVELAFRLAIALEQFWVMNDPFEGARRLGALLERAEEVAPELRAQALRACGESMWISGDLEGGERVMDESFDAFQAIGDERSIAVVLHRRAVSALIAGDNDRARRLLEESLEICSRLPDAKLEADAIGKLGWVERRDGNRERALELFERSATLCQEIGYTWMLANGLIDGADLSHELGRVEVAEERAREGLRLSMELHDRQYTMFAVALLARFAASGGDAARAGRLWGAIEAEESRAPVGQWENEREEYAAAVVQDGDPEFEAARAAGRRLTWDAAVDFALTGRNEPTPSSGEVNA
ncbi:MAG TPA: tetratricopeptide repeat protein [Gaiellaceae bacterium]|nr:tetratricopeptide repeat protein [Gaiellaceae bacterium]